MNSSKKEIISEVIELKNKFENFSQKKLLPILNNIYETLDYDNQKIGISSGLTKQEDQKRYFLDHIINSSYIGQNISDKHKLGSDILTALGYGRNFDEVLTSQFPVKSDYIQIQASEIEYDHKNYTGKRHAKVDINIQNIPIFEDREALYCPIHSFTNIGLGYFDLEKNTLGLKLTRELYASVAQTTYGDTYWQGDHTRPNGRVGFSQVAYEMINNYVLYGKKQLTIGTYMTIAGQFKKTIQNSHDQLPQEYLNDKLEGILQLTLNEKNQLCYELTL